LQLAIRPYFLQAAFKHPRILPGKWKELLQHQGDENYLTCLTSKDMALPVDHRAVVEEKTGMFFEREMESCYYGIVHFGHNMNKLAGIYESTVPESTVPI
jgi:hypothetical protein